MAEDGFGVRRRPENAAGDPVRVHEGEARTDSGAGCYEDDFAEEEGCVEEAVEWVATYPEVGGGVEDVAFCPGCWG